MVFQLAVSADPIHFVCNSQPAFLKKVKFAYRSSKINNNLIQFRKMKSAVEYYSLTQILVGHLKRISDGSLPVPSPALPPKVPFTAHSKPRLPRQWKEKQLQSLSGGSFPQGMKKAHGKQPSPA